MEHNVLSLMERLPDEASAYQFLEELRWGDKPVCPHCGSIAKHYFLTAKGEGRKTRTGNVSQRRVWKCRDCRKQFTVLVGTIFHGTKIPVRTWVLVVFEMCSSKNGVAAREIARKYGLTEKSAWFMTQRIREAMKRDPMAGLLAGTVIADETWIGGKPGNRHRSKGYGTPGKTDKTPVVSLVHPETGEVRSAVVPNVKAENLRAVIKEQTDMASTVLHTDENAAYRVVARETAGHETVNHTWGEYVRAGITTNHVEGFFSQLKRSIDGTHHAVSVEHLPRYLAEFDYRYSTRKVSDTERMRMLLGRVSGRRLTWLPVTID